MLVLILLEICKNLNIGIVVPTIDTELVVLSSNRKIFAENGIIIAVSDLDFIQRCRDKRMTNEIFNELSIDIPKPIDKFNPEFPLFIKPYDGSLSKDILLLKNSSEWRDSLLLDERLMFMEYLSPEDYQEFTVDAYFDNNGILKCLVPRRRIEVRGGEISKGRTEKSDLYFFLLNKIKFLKGARSCLTIQFFEHHRSKNVIGIEINPRFGGGFPLSYSAGALYPAFLINEYLLNKDIPFFDSWIENRVMLRYDAEIIIDE